MTIKKNDFVEIEFIAKVKNGEVFDTNISSEVKKAGLELKNVKPYVLSVGHEMVIKGLDKDLEGKEVGKKYSVEITPEEGFGKRNPQLIRMMPKKIFLEHQMNPVAGMTLTLDNHLAKIISVSGGRVMIDFNHPLAGKDLEFTYTIKKKIDDIKIKVDSLQQFFFRKVFEYDLDDTKKKIIFKDTQLTQVLGMFRDKFKELTGYDVEIFAKKDNAEKPTEKPTEKKE